MWVAIPWAPHGQLLDQSIQVVMTGDRSDVCFKAYFDGAVDREGLEEWSASPLQTRRAARKLMSSPIVRRADRQDLMVLALNTAMKLEYAAAWEKQLAQLQSMFRPDLTPEQTFCEMALYDWQGFTSKGMVRGLASNFVERTPFFDNEVWDLSLSLPPEWRERARIIRRAVSLTSPRLARIPDVSTGIPPIVPWPWDGYYARLRQSVRNLAKKGSRHSTTLAALRPPPEGTQVFTASGSHDRNAALRLCPAYRKLVTTSVEQLTADYFDTRLIQDLLESDLSTAAPRYGSLFEIIITFAQFDRQWGERAQRQPCGRPHPSDSSQIPAA